MIPGATQLTFMLLFAKLKATVLVRPSNAVLLTEYAPRSYKSYNAQIYKYINAILIEYVLKMIECF